MNGSKGTITQDQLDELLGDGSKHHYSPEELGDNFNQNVLLFSLQTRLEKLEQEIAALKSQKTTQTQVTAGNENVDIIPPAFLKSLGEQAEELDSLVKKQEAAYNSLEKVTISEELIKKEDELTERLRTAIAEREKTVESGNILADEMDAMTDRINAVLRRQQEIKNRFLGYKTISTSPQKQITPPPTPKTNDQFSEFEGEVPTYLRKQFQ